MNAQQYECYAQLQALARSRGGACLSSEYRNAHHKMHWRCAEGHEWDAVASSVLRGRWCRVCANETRHRGEKARTFSSVQAIAQEKGGCCLSTEYVSCRIQLSFRCAEGHEWAATAAMVRQGRWCPACPLDARYDDMRVFARVQAIARERGGLCLSTEYVNSQTHLRFRCAEAHEWQAMPSNISRGTWCPRCAGKLLTIDDIRDIARAHGGRCLSRSFRGDLIPLRWRCAEGHEWEACQGNVRRGTWCPHCSGRATKTIADVQATAAGHGGVCLSTTIESNLEPLRFRCRVGHEFEKNANHLQRGKWCPRCRTVPRGTLKRLREVVRLRGGVLLDTEYHGSHVPVRVRCREGHEWSAKPASLLGGRWCLECSIVAARGRSQPRLSLIDMQEVAASRGGRCLSEDFVNSTTPLRWRCHDGHEWDAPAARIRCGQWCPACAHRYRGTIDGMRALAAERGGTCRSRTYRNQTDLLRFTCARGHEFIAPGMAVKSGAWCPACGEWDPPTSERPRRRGPTRSQ